MDEREPRQSQSRPLNPVLNPVNWAVLILGALIYMTFGVYIQSQNTRPTAPERARSSQQVQPKEVLKQPAVAKLLFRESNYQEYQALSRGWSFECSVMRPGGAGQPQRLNVETLTVYLLRKLRGDSINTKTTIDMDMAVSNSPFYLVHGLRKGKPTRLLGLLCPDVRGGVSLVALQRNAQVSLGQLLVLSVPATVQLLPRDRLFTAAERQQVEVAFRDMYRGLEGQVDLAKDDDVAIRWAVHYRRAAMPYRTGEWPTKADLLMSELHTGAAVSMKSIGVIATEYFYLPPGKDEYSSGKPFESSLSVEELLKRSEQSDQEDAVRRQGA